MCPGFDWNTQKTHITLAEALGQVDARGIVVETAVGQRVPGRLALAWANSDQVPFLLGQVNIFQAFDVCFFRPREVFEIRQPGVSSSSSRVSFFEKYVSSVIRRKAGATFAGEAPPARPEQGGGLAGRTEETAQRLSPGPLRPLRFARHPPLAWQALAGSSHSNPADTDPKILDGQRTASNGFFRIVAIPVSPFFGHGALDR